MPLAHPDIDPPHEALQLVEQYREALRLLEVDARPEELRRWLAEAEKDAEGLEAALRGRAGVGVEAAWKKAGAACTRCHAGHRDLPRRR